GATVAAVSISGTGAITGGTCTVGAVLAGNTCTVVVNSATTGTGTVNVQADVPVSTVSVHVDSNGHGAFQVSNQKTWVDARITIQQSGTNQAGSPHTFTVTFTKDLCPARFAAELGATVAAVSISGAGAITGGSCTVGAVLAG